MPDSDCEFDDDNENDTLEVSPNSRWHKLRKKVINKDSLGIEEAHLAYDTENGIEVVWNQITFSPQRMSEENIQNLNKKFKSLTALNHNNIVKYYDYWIDREKRQIVVITELLTSGTVKQHLRKTLKMNKTVLPKVWKRWCVQILSALKYLHEQTPSIVHGNLKVGSIFIQHNGLVKVGAVCLEDINEHVRTIAGDQFQWIAPEVYDKGTLNDKSDIYAFGMCCLEMATGEVPYSECPSAGERNRKVLTGQFPDVIFSISDPDMLDFIKSCLMEEERRPSADDLLFHRFFFEVPLLKVMVAHYILRRKSKYQSKLDSLSEEIMGFLKDVGAGAWGNLVNVQGTDRFEPKSTSSSISNLATLTSLPAPPDRLPLASSSLLVAPTTSTGPLMVPLSTISPPLNAPQNVVPSSVSSTSSTSTTTTTTASSNPSKGSLPFLPISQPQILPQAETTRNEKRRLTSLRKITAEICSSDSFEDSSSALLKVHLIYVLSDHMNRELIFQYRTALDSIHSIVQDMILNGLLNISDGAVMEKILGDIIHPCIHNLHVTPLQPSKEDSKMVDASSANSTNASIPFSNKPSSSSSTSSSSSLAST